MRGGELRWGAADVGTTGFGMADTVTDYRINQPIPPAVFQVDFPEGVSVRDIDAEEARKAKARAVEADAIAERWAAPEKPPWKSGGIDPQFNARDDIGSALNSARETGKRVLIEFGAQGHPDCGKLYDLLKGNAEIAARVRKDFVLVLVDTDYHNNGGRLYENHVREKLRKNLPAICVRDAGGTVLNVNDSTGLKTGDEYGVAKLSAYLEKWSRK
jgi:Thioredoxin-like